MEGNGRGMAKKIMLSCTRLGRMIGKHNSPRELLCARSPGRETNLMASCTGGEESYISPYEVTLKPGYPSRNVHYWCPGSLAYPKGVLMCFVLVQHRCA